MAKFSIIIPAYNVEKFLDDCLLSIQYQNFTDFEVLIVDDGSMDNTIQVAQKYTTQDSRFILIKKENGGVSSARNIGLKHATGEFIWFVDGDDYIHPESLAYIYHLYSEYPNADYVTFEYEWTKKHYNGYFQSLNSLIKSHPEYFICTELEGFENALRFSPIAVCCVCYRRSLTVGVTFKNIITSEDRLYALEMCFSAKAVVHTRTKIYYYYQRAGSASSQSTRKFIGDLFEFADELFEFRFRKHGWGGKHIHFLSNELFTEIMRHLLRLPHREDRKWAFEQLLALMTRVQNVFSRTTVNNSINRIITKKSFVLAWSFLYLRYQPRRIISRRPVLLRLYQWTNSLFDKIRQP